MEFIHKPTRVNAQVYHGPGTLSPEFADAICQGPCPSGGVRYGNGQRLDHIDTLHGPVQLEVGHWVVEETFHPGEFYPLHPDEFDARYDPAGFPFASGRTPSGICSAHRDGEDLSCVICYPRQAGVTA